MEHGQPSSQPYSQNQFQLLNLFKNTPSGICAGASTVTAGGRGPATEWNLSQSTYTYIECDRKTASAPMESADQAARVGGRVSTCRTLYRYVLCDTHVCVTTGVPLPPTSPSPREMSVCLYTTGGRGGEVDQGHWSA